MRNRLFFDIPVRVFHWIFAGLFITAFLIAKTVDDESPAFSYHMLAGILLAGVVTLRILWGLIGGESARFSSFALRPGDLADYLSGIFKGSKRKWEGRNPASSWAALAMMTLALGLAATGIMMTNGSKETFEDLHELLSHAFLVVVLLHVAGVILHGLRHRDGIAFSMVDGRKAGISGGASAARSYPIAALVFILLFLSFAGYLANRFDSSSGTLRIMGTSFQLGESEEDEEM
jgi:cytochrome b